MKLYTSSETLMPSLSDAFTVHDAAHESKDTGLHEVALKLLALHQIDHVVTDTELDSPKEYSDWDRLPASICVDEEIASVIGEKDGKFTITSCDSEICKSLSKCGTIKEKSFHRYGPRIPAYEMWLIKKNAPVMEEPESTIKPLEWVETGFPRKSGAYRFPVLAVPVQKDYKLYQVHKLGDEVTIFDRNGKEPAGMAGVIDKFVECLNDGVWECVKQGDRFEIFDVLYQDGIDCTKLPLSERRSVIKNSVYLAPFVMDGVTLETNTELFTLKPSAYLIRHIDDRLSDLIRPFWFYYEAGVIRTGTPLPWLKPASEEVVEKSPSDRIVAPLFNGPTMQIHKDNWGVSIFVSEGGRNRSASFPQIVEACSTIPEDFIIECTIDCEEDGLPVSISRIQNPKGDLSDCKITAYAYDLLLWGDEDISQVPMFKRVEMLESVMEDMQSDHIKYAYEIPVTSGDALSWSEDSKRPIDSNVNENCVLLQIG